MKEIYNAYNKYEYWLSCLSFLPGRKKIYLVNVLGDAKALYHISQKDLEHLSFLTVPEKEKIKMAQEKTELKLEQEIEYCVDNQIWLAVWQQEMYPRKLEDIYNPPYGLFYRGNFPDSGQTIISVVGARNCSVYGKITAEQIGRGLAAAGIGVVSGMAAGIDGAAQGGAIQGGGYTCGVLGCGVNVCYPPSNRELYGRLIEKGCVLTEYPPNAKPLAVNFPQRNRIISGLSDGVLVVEAKEQSGSLITADFALEQGREIYAVPGRVSDILSQGTNRLIRQGAGIFLNMEDFLKEMHIFTKSGGSPGKKQKITLENLEWLVYSCLDLTPRNLEEILSGTGLTLGDLTEILEKLQEMGCVSQVYKNYYIRSDEFV